MGSQFDRLSPAEMYAISVISRTPTAKGKADVAARFDREVFADDADARQRVRKHFVLSTPRAVVG